MWTQCIIRTINNVKITDHAVMLSHMSCCHAISHVVLSCYLTCRAVMLSHMSCCHATAYVVLSCYLTCRAVMLSRMSCCHVISHVVLSCYLICRVTCKSKLTASRSNFFFANIVWKYQKRFNNCFLNIFREFLFQRKGFVAN